MAPNSTPSVTLVSSHRQSPLSLYSRERERVMGRSRRKYKQSRTKVRVGLPKRKLNVFKPAFCLPPKLRALLEQQGQALAP
ncbi:hypothetical protein ACFX12_035793 [Malus domestica]